MPPRHAICLFVDGFRASALGAYGGAGIATPALNQLASQSIVADWLWTAGPTIESFYDAVATGFHPLRVAAHGSETAGGGMYRELSQSGVRLDFITDDPSGAGRFDSNGHGQVQLLDLPVGQLASVVDETRFAQLLAIAAEQWLSVEGAQESRLLWIHASGWHGPWDAPLEIRKSLLAEDELAPSSAVDVVIESPGDPDELLIARTAYLAQLAVLDECMESFLAAIATSRLAEETLLVVGGVRGFALGEHGHFGRDACPCYNEFVHTPLLVRPPGATMPLPRDGNLRSPCDITATLLDWLSTAEAPPGLDGRSLLAGASAGSARMPRPWNVCLGDNDLALRTPAWMLRQTEPDETNLDGGVELYAKPDDRWEANEIADRCPDAAEAAVALVDRLRTLAADGLSLDDVEIAEFLTDASR